MQPLLQKLLYNPKNAPSLSFNFIDGSAFSPQITFTRASTATYFDSAGVLQSAAIDAPRFDYNPATLAARGLLIEEARTNSIRNNTMQGAVAGTPGTLPTDWSFVSTQGNGLTTTIVGTGTENGISYIDYRFNGTTVNTNTIVIGIDFGSALTGQTWTASNYWRLVGGSTTGMTSWSVGLIENTSGGVFVAGAFYAQTAPTTAALNTQRQIATRTLSGGATVAQCQMNLSFAPQNATAIDFTIRIGLPQLELGAFATSVIPTTTTALTRAADVASVNTLSPWYNASQGTLYAEFTGVASGTRTIAAVNDGTSNESIRLRTVGTDPKFTVTDGGVDQADINGGTVATGVTYRFGGAYALNNFAASINGGTVQTDNSGTLPTVTQLMLGNSASSNYLNGYLRKFAYYPVRLPDAQLQAITA
jgi:hypothetical protein